MLVKRSVVETLRDDESVRQRVNDLIRAAGGRNVVDSIESAFDDSPWPGEWDNHHDDGPAD